MVKPWKVNDPVWLKGVAEPTTARNPFRYDLSQRIASFDFYNWLVIAASMGTDEIVFGVDPVRVKTTKWPVTEVMRRFKSIIEPGPTMLGLSSRVGRGGLAFDECAYKGVSHSMAALVQHVRSGRTFPRLRSVKPLGKERYTVTLRNDKRIPHRNSNDAAWRAFAKEIGALVIEDYEVKPMDLHDRMALYAGAEMNFGVPNGPLHMVALSDYPVTMFCGMAVGAMENCGIKRGTQYPWANERQRLVWEMDTLDTLRRWVHEGRYCRASS